MKRTADENSGVETAHGFGAGCGVFVFAFWIHVYQCLSLPLVVTEEGVEYARIASHLFPEAGVREALFERGGLIATPLYPILLRGAFLLFGKSALAVVVLHAAFSYLAVLAVFRLVLPLAGTAAAVMSVVLLSLWPLSIAYQHSFLPESGAALIFVLIAAALMDFVKKPTLISCVILSAWLTIAAAFRPEFLFLAPCCSLLALAVFFLRKRKSAGSRLRFLSLAALLITIFPSLLSSPWMVAAGLPSVLAASSSLFPSSMSSTPSAVRTLQLFLGGEPRESVNDLFTMKVFSGEDENLLLVSPAQREHTKELFSTKVRSSFFQRFEQRLSSGPVLRKILLFLHFGLLCLFFFGIIRRDLSLCIIPCLIVSFYLIQAFLLQATDRAAFPAYFLLVPANLVFAARALRWVLDPVVMVERRRQIPGPRHRPFESCFSRGSVREIIEIHGRPNQG